MIGVAGKKPTGIHWIVKTLLYWGYPLVSSRMGYKYLHVFAHFDRSIHTPIPKISLSPIFQSCSLIPSDGGGEATSSGSGEAVSTGKENLLEFKCSYYPQLHQSLPIQSHSNF